MTISSVASGKRLFTYLLIIGAVSAVAACGGSGGKKKSSSSSVSSTMIASSSVSSSSVAPDTRPEPFSFTSQADAEREQQVYSNTVTIAGIDAPTNISIEGNGYYAVGDGENWVAIDSEVNNGDQVRLRVQAKSGFSEIETVTLTVGDQSAEFSVTTLARDVEPDAFTFVDISDAELDSVVDSNEIIIQGVNAETPVSVVGGQYAINGDSFVESGSEGVVAGDRVKVQGSAPGLFSASQEVVLTVGGVSDTFTISTPVDDEAPTVELYFPTAKGLTAATTLTVRGIATDSMSPITSVVVNGVEATVTGEKAVTWLAEITLTAPGDTDIVVTATDDAGNASEPIIFSKITNRVDLTGSFNVTDATMKGFYGLQFLNNYTRLFVAEDMRNYYFVDPLTGATSLASEAADPVAHDASVNGRTFIARQFEIEGKEGLFVGGESGIFSVNLDTGVRTLLSNASFADDSLDFSRLWNLSAYVGKDLQSSFFLTSSLGSAQLIKVDSESGEKSIFSDLSDASLGEVWVDIDSLVIDSEKKIAYLGADNSLFQIDLISGKRKLVAARSSEVLEPKLPNRNFIFSKELNTIFGVTAESGKNPIVSVGLSDGYKVLEYAEDNVPGLYDEKSMAVSPNKKIVYESYTKGVGVSDLETGNQIILFKVDG